jgi:hypothetical protein
MVEFERETPMQGNELLVDILIQIPIYALHIY